MTDERLNKFNFPFEKKIKYDTDYVLAGLNKYGDFDSILWAKVNDDVKVYFDNSYERTYGYTEKQKKLATNKDDIRDPLIIQFKHHGYKNHSDTNTNVFSFHQNEYISDGDAVWITISPTFISSSIDDNKIKKMGDSSSSDLFIKWSDKNKRMELSFDNAPPSSKHFIFKYSKGYNGGFHIVVYRNDNQKHIVLGTTRHDMVCSKYKLGPNYDDNTIDIGREGDSDRSKRLFCATWDDEANDSFSDESATNLPLSEQLDNVTDPLFVIPPNLISNVVVNSENFDKSKWYNKFKWHFTEDNWRTQFMDWKFWEWRFDNPYTYYKLYIVLIIVAIIIKIIMRLLS